MLNKYDKMYSEFLDKLAKVHNDHVLFKKRMNYRNAKNLRKSFVDFHEYIDEIKREILAIQRKYREEVLEVRKKEREQQKENKK
jgi:hypothetical protein